MSRLGEFKPHVSALVLAAGCSSRFGGDNKLLREWRGELLIQHALKPIVESNVVDITVVTGHQHELLDAAISHTDYGKPVRTLYNSAYRTGMASSLTHGVTSLKESDAIIVCLADMPRISSDVFNTLVQTFIQYPDKSMYIPVFNGTRGNPVLIANQMFDAILSLKGDTGARTLARQHPEWVQEVPVECRGTHLDVDTIEALKAL